MKIFRSYASRAIRSNGAWAYPHSSCKMGQRSRERDDRTPHAEQYHLPCIRTPLSDHAPVSEWPFIAPLLLHSSRPHSSIRLRGLDGGALGTLGRAGLESVAELAVDGLEVAHAAGTGGLPSLGLLAPVELAGLSSRVAA